MFMFKQNSNQANERKYLGVVIHITNFNYFTIVICA